MVIKVVHVIIGYANITLLLYVHQNNNIRGLDGERICAMLRRMNS